jgi:PhnB protein
MNTINPYVAFNGKCREAMTFYQACFGGELELQEVTGSPVEQSWKGGKDQVFHSSLTVHGSPFLMGSDMLDRDGYVKGNDIALAIGCSSEAEIRSVFENLSNGGKVLAPLKVEFWGAVFGTVKDRYGIKWFLNHDKK